jgi:hypothetical protein
MLGTAFPAARLVLVEQPFPWGPEGLRTSRFDPATALALEARGRAAGVRIQAIRRLGRTPVGATRSWAAVDTRGDTPTVRWGKFTEDAELLEVPLDGSPGVPDPDPLYLVCTHGRHDPCCGQRGHAVAAALAALRPDRVWQSSHLGGCRFAPTVLVLPLGLMYGRVDADDAEEFIAAAEAGEVVGAHLRGRIGIPPPAQAGLSFAHEHLGLSRRQDVSLVSTTPASDGASVRVRVDSPAGQFDITVERHRVDAAGLTCGSPGPSWFVAHRPVAIAAVDET